MGAAAVDLVRPPERQLSARALLAAIRLYQESVPLESRWLRGRCRLEPTCSAYAAEAVRRHGALRGSLLAVRRVCRCGPWTPPGTRDPVPSTL
ncbi:MAG: membrane protein insertion efficiency factor YidD [Acidobacteriota bacterium]